MGEVIKFERFRCDRCTFAGKLSNCTNEDYIKNCYQVVKKGWCPYFKEIGKEKQDEL